MNSLTLKAIAEAIAPMRHSRLGNYIVPGLTSHLVGGGEFGKVRVFSAGRSARDFITPHSHRFDFTCLVLSGIVHNTLFIRSDRDAEEWGLSTIGQVCGADGALKYVHTRAPQPTFWHQEAYTYVSGDTYHMSYMDIHSIQFEKGSEVLFFEGPPKAPGSVMLEPWVDGQVVPTFKTEPWMFQRTPQNLTHPSH